MNRFVLLIGSLLLMGACTKQESHEIDLNHTPSSVRKPGEDGHIQVQHILIAFKGSLPGKQIERSKTEAKNKAGEIFRKAQTANVEEFSDLVTRFSDDQTPGIYFLSNFGEEPGADEYPRKNMVQGFGDLAFSLQKGEVGFLSFDPKASPYGFHIMLRLK